VRTNLKANMVMRSLNKMLDEHDDGMKTADEVLTKMKAFLSNKGLRFRVIEK
jgi:hypothetical protein